MLLMIDNYDSFTYNVVQYLGELGADVHVVRNDEIAVADFVKTLPGSPVSVLVRLMIAEGPKHPDLLQFYWDNVISRGLGALNKVIERGVENGEFRPSVVNEFPHLFVMPVVFSVIFRLLFAASRRWKS